MNPEVLRVMREAKRVWDETCVCHDTPWTHFAFFLKDAGLPCTVKDVLQGLLWMMQLGELEWCEGRREGSLRDVRMTERKALATR